MLKSSFSAKTPVLAYSWAVSQRGFWFPPKLLKSPSLDNCAKKDFSFLFINFPVWLCNILWFCFCKVQINHYFTNLTYLSITLCDIIFYLSSMPCIDLRHFFICRDCVSLAGYLKFRHRWVAKGSLVIHIFHIGEKAEKHYKNQTTFSPIAFWL